ncbi:MAG: hypothetical protein M3281_03205 [Chloroflexota bacterium]|nr:hypothetical protein [Chloroflexota bacterium]
MVKRLVTLITLAAGWVLFRAWRRAGTTETGPVLREAKIVATEYATRLQEGLSSLRAQGLSRSGPASSRNIAGATLTGPDVRQGEESSELPGADPDLGPVYDARDSADVPNAPDVQAHEPVVLETSAEQFREPVPDVDTSSIDLGTAESSTADVSEPDISSGAAAPEAEVAASEELVFTSRPQTEYADASATDLDQPAASSSAPGLEGAAVERRVFTARRERQESDVPIAEPESSELLPTASPVSEDATSATYGEIQSDREATTGDVEALSARQDTDTPVEGLLEAPDAPPASQSSLQGGDERAQVSGTGELPEHDLGVVTREETRDQEGHPQFSEYVNPETQEELLEMNVSPHSGVATEDYQHVEASLPPETLEAIEQMNDASPQGGWEDFPVEAGYSVEALDGGVGSVDRVERSASSEPSIVVREGLLFKEDVRIPYSAIDRVEGNTVYLNIDKQYLKLMSGDHTPHTGDSSTRIQST